MRIVFLIPLFYFVLTACDSTAHTPEVAAQAGKTELISNTVTALETSSMSAGAIPEAYATHRNVPQVQGSGVVVKLLKDDNKGLQHQKFLLKVSNNITILIAHNIDLAPRINDIYEGDVVQFKGEYIYTPKGGTVHWTHKDPRGNHQAGWLKHNGKTYE